MEVIKRFNKSMADSSLSVLKVSAGTMSSDGTDGILRFLKGTPRSRRHTSNIAIAPTASQALEGKKSINHDLLLRRSEIPSNHQHPKHSWEIEINRQQPLEYIIRDARKNRRRIDCL